MNKQNIKRGLYLFFIFAIFYSLSRGLIYYLISSRINILFFSAETRAVAVSVLYSLIHVAFTLLYIQLTKLWLAFKMEYISFKKIYAFFIGGGVYIITFLVIRYLITGASFNIPSSIPIRSYAPAAIFFLVTCIVIFGDEIVFRGLIYTSLKVEFSEKTAAILTSFMCVFSYLLYMMDSVNIFKVIYVFVFSLAMIMLFEKTESLWWNVGIRTAGTFLSVADSNNKGIVIFIDFAIFVYLAYYFIKENVERRSIYE